MVGLIQAMVQSGLLVPVHPNSAMGLFKQILTDIGDNQSIENQLSTYSYRLKRMKGFLSEAGRNTLLLLDEFGTAATPSSEVPSRRSSSRSSTANRRSG